MRIEDCSQNSSAVERPRPKFQAGFRLRPDRAVSLPNSSFFLTLRVGKGFAVAEQKIRVLCLEDDRDTCELTKLILEAKGYELISTNISVEAMRLIGAAGFSLCSIDENSQTARD